MFLQIFILVVCIPAILTADNAAYGRAVEECNKQYYFSGRLNTTEIMRLSTCKMACIMKEVGTMAENGYYLMDNIVGRVPQEHSQYLEVIAELRKCAELPVDKDECVTARNLRNCVTNNVPCKDFWGCTVNTHAYLFNIDW